MNNCERLPNVSKMCIIILLCKKFPAHAVHAFAMVSAMDTHACQKRLQHIYI